MFWVSTPYWCTSCNSCSSLLCTSMLRMSHCTISQSFSIGFRWLGRPLKSCSWKHIAVTFMHYWAQVAFRRQGNCEWPSTILQQAVVFTQWLICMNRSKLCREHALGRFVQWIHSANAKLRPCHLCQPKLRFNKAGYFFVFTVQCWWACTHCSLIFLLAKRNRANCDLLLLIYLKTQHV